MSTQNDLHIFVTGVVGRAMGSGKFTDQDILMLTQAAYNTFLTIFGKPETQQKAPPKSSYEALTFDVRAVQMPEPNLPAANFEQWKNDKAYYGKKEWDAWGKPWPDVTWDELYSRGASGDQKALKALAAMANSAPQEGQWAERSKQKIARAKAVQLMIQSG